MFELSYQLMSLNSFQIITVFSRKIDNRKKIKKKMEVNKLQKKS